MKAEEFLKQATKGTEAGEVIEESHLRLAIIALLDNYRDIIVKECSIPDVVCSATKCMCCEVDIKKDEGLLFCGDCGR